MNNYTKFHADLVNVDIAIEEEDNVLIFLNYLLDEEYETFILILINDKQSLNYSDVSAALVNYEVRRKDKQSSFSSTTAETNHRKGKGRFEKSKTDDREDLMKTGVLSIDKKDTGRLLVQISNRRRKSLNQRLISHRCMVMILTHLVIHFLSPH